MGYFVNVRVRSIWVFVMGLLAIGYLAMIYLVWVWVRIRIIATEFISDDVRKFYFSNFGSLGP